MLRLNHALRYETLYFLKFMIFTFIHLQRLKFIIEMLYNMKTTLWCNDLTFTHFSFHQNLILNPWMFVAVLSLQCVLKANIEIFKRRCVNNEAILTWLRVVEEGLSSASEHNVIAYNAIHLCWVRLVDKRHKIQFRVKQNNV